LGVLQKKNGYSGEFPDICTEEITKQKGDKEQ